MSPVAPDAGSDGHNTERGGEGNGRGSIATPPEDTPIKRGPPEDKVKPEHESKGPKVEEEAPSVDQQHGAQAEDQAHGQKSEQSGQKVEEEDG